MGDYPVFLFSFTGTVYKDQFTGIRKQLTRNRVQGTGYREQGTGNSDVFAEFNCSPIGKSRGAFPWGNRRCPPNWGGTVWGF